MNTNYIVLEAVWSYKSKRSSSYRKYTLRLTVVGNWIALSHKGKPKCSRPLFRTSTFCMLASFPISKTLSQTLTNLCRAITEYRIICMAMPITKTHLGLSKLASSPYLIWLQEEIIHYQLQAKVEHFISMETEAQLNLEFLSFYIFMNINILLLLFVI